MSKIFETFSGSFVSIIVKNMRGSGQDKINNLALGGYLLDECEEYYYIGETPMEVTAAIKKDSVAAVILAVEAGMDTGDMQ